ncbi:hypothetical protein B0H13DRAFT_2653139 [Mycena leptocephala]|nr:hypothetical protein B0H13DRAFT_2653139 [Mycena leptocephala]
MGSLHRVLFDPQPYLPDFEDAAILEECISFHEIDIDPSTPETQVVAHPELENKDEKLNEETVILADLSEDPEHKDT